MSLAGLPEWVSELISKGESVSACLSLYKEMQATEREERASEREMRKTEIESEVRLKELEIREKELSQGANRVHISDKLKSKLPKFKEGDDPDVYLKSFERLLVLHKVHKREWALRLIPLLTGKALEAFSRLSEEDSVEYEKVKMAILVRYELTSEAYREKFRNAFQLRDESFREYTVRVEGFLRHWCKREDISVNFEKLFDFMMREKLLSGCDKDLKLWVQEHRPRNVNTLVELAESFQGARKHVQVGSSIKSQSGNSFPKRQQNNNRSQDSQYKKEIRTCFKCNRQGHITSYYPTSQNVKFKPGKLGLCIEKTQNQVSDEKSEGVKRYVSGITVRLPGVSGIDHTEKKVSGIEIVDGKVNEQSVKCSQRYRKFNCYRTRKIC